MDNLVELTKGKMSKSVESYESELSTVRTGIASASILDKIEDFIQDIINPGQNDNTDDGESTEGNGDGENTDGSNENKNLNVENVDPSVDYGELVGPGVGR